MHYDDEYESVSGILCNNSYLCDWDDGMPMHTPQENIQNMKDIQSRIEQKNYCNDKESRLMKFSLKATKNLQK